MNSSRALLHPHDLARDAFDLPHMFVGFLKWKTIGPGKAGQQHGSDQQRVLISRRHGARLILTVSGNFCGPGRGLIATGDLARADRYDRHLSAEAAIETSS